MKEPWTRRRFLADNSTDMSPYLLISTLVLPGLWGVIVGWSGHRWWPARPAPRPDRPKAFRVTDYDI